MIGLAIMVYEPLYHALQTITVRVCSKLKTSWKSFAFTIKVGNSSRNFVGVFNKTVIPLALVGYEIIIANSVLRLVGYLPSHISPTRTRRIIVKYILRKPSQTSVKIDLLIQNIVSIDLNLRFNNISLLLGNFRNCIYLAEIFFQ